MLFTVPLHAVCNFISRCSRQQDQVNKDHKGFHD